MSPQAHICYPCKRKFQAADLLDRHERVSDLHRQNIDKLDQVAHARKEELRAAIVTLRQQLQEADAALGDQVLHNETLANQRTLLEMGVRQLLGEYGQAQERIELRREAKIEGRRTQKPQPLQSEARVGRLQISTGCATWQGNKDAQEDRYLLEISLEFQGHNLAGFAVLDGHSGSLCVDAVCERLPVNLQKCLSNKPGLTEEHLAQAVAEACVLTDDEFLKKARQHEVLDGTTLILAIIYPEDARTEGVRAPGSCRLLIANVGDSRAVLCRAGVGGGDEGERLMAVRLSDDHKPSRPDERRRIEARGGLVDMQGVWRVMTPGPTTFGGRTIMKWGLAVSRAFGDLLLKEPERYGCQGVMPGGLITAVPEIRVIDIQPDEDRFLILACDGIWDVLSDDDAVAVCASQAGGEEASLALIKRAFAVGSDDNLTAAVITWKEAP